MSACWRRLSLTALEGLWRWVFGVAALAGSFWVWFELVQWAGRAAIAGPVAAGREPNVVLYSAMMIVSSLGLFTLWAVLSWVLSVAPLVAMLRGVGPLAALRGAF